MVLERPCPFCKTVTKIELTEGEANALNRGELVQRACPNKNKFERETLINGLCFGCQERTFNMPAPGNETAWGDELGECECCGGVIWSIKNKKANRENEYLCPSCYCSYKLESGKLVDITEEPEDYE